MEIELIASPELPDGPEIIGTVVSMVMNKGEEEDEVFPKISVAVAVSE